MSAVGLPLKWRFRVWNQSGKTLNVGLEWRGHKLTSTGELDYGDYEAVTNQVFDYDDDDNNQIASEAYLPNDTNGSETYGDNSTDKYLGLEAWWKIKGPADNDGFDGQFMIFLQTYSHSASPGDDLKWQEVGEGIIVASVYLFNNINNFRTGGTFMI